jgi:hypothetical protein
MIQSHRIFTNSKPQNQFLWSILSCEERSNHFIMNPPQTWSKLVFVSFIIMFFSFMTHTEGIAQECSLGNADSLQAAGVVQERPNLSGTPIIIATANFRVHYTTSGQDLTTTQWAQAVADYAEEVRVVLSNLGWALPPHDFGSDSSGGRA